jgi:hypothetical protein
MAFDLDTTAERDSFINYSRRHEVFIGGAGI